MKGHLLNRSRRALLKNLPLSVRNFLVVLKGRSELSADFMSRFLGFGALYASMV
jgi:hypothetical protein